MSQLNALLLRRAACGLTETLALFFEHFAAEQSWGVALTEPNMALVRGEDMNVTGEIQLIVSEDDPDVAYVQLRGHPGKRPGSVKRTVSVRDLVADYAGPDINLDFGDGNSLIGIEIVG